MSVRPAVETPYTGSVRWTIWQGQLHPLLPEIIVSHRLGVDGDDYETFGNRARPSTVRLMNYAVSQPALVEAVAEVQALIGTTVECRDADGTLWPAVLVQDLTIISKRRTPERHAAPEANGVLRRTAYRLEVDMTLIVQPTPSES